MAHRLHNFRGFSRRLAGPAQREPPCLLFWLACGVFGSVNSDRGNRSRSGSSLPECRPSSSSFDYAGILRPLVPLVRDTPILRRRVAYHATIFGVFSLYWTGVPLLLASPAPRPAGMQDQNERDYSLRLGDLAFEALFSVGQPQDHLAAWLRASGFEAGQMPGRTAGGKRQRFLAQPADLAPAAQQHAIRQHRGGHAAEPTARRAAAP